MYQPWRKLLSDFVSLTSRQIPSWPDTGASQTPGFLRQVASFVCETRGSRSLVVLLVAVMTLGFTRPAVHAQVINYPSGFANASADVWMENFASFDGSLIHLVPSKVHNGSNAWFKTPENVQAFSTTFTFHIDCSADPSDCGGGFGFMMICACTGGNPVYDPPGKPGFTYSGYSGAQFSWSQCEQPLTPASEYCFNNGSNGNSGTNLKQLPDNIIVTFNNYDNNPPGLAGVSLTTYATHGVFPAAPVTAEYNMAPSGINLNSGHLFRATLTYNGSTLTESLTDTVTGANYTHEYEANIPAAITGNTAFIGFGGGTGAAVDDVYIHSWTYSAGSTGSSGTAATPMPTFSPAAGTYSSAQSVKISDTASGAVIYVTTDGSTPTTNSEKYTGAITVKSTETVKAMAVVSGDTDSGVASASYVMSSEPVVATPTFSPGAGTYSSAQSVKISDATAGATIYVTTDGSTPTIHSDKYTDAITVSSTETVKAMAVASNETNSNATLASYTISATAPGSVINYPNGFTGSPSSIDPINNAFYSGSTIQLTSLKGNEASNVYFKTPVNVQAFSTTFTWTVKCPGGSTGCGDGMGFMIISTTNPKSPGYWSGGSGGSLSWSSGCTQTGADCEHINSVLVKFDLYNSTEKGNLTGLYTGGEYPQPPNAEYNMAPSGINMQSGHRMRAELTYNGTTLYETVTDTVTNATYTNNYKVNIPSQVGGNTALVGFCGGSGAAEVQQNIESWTYTVQLPAASVATTPVVATPTFSPVAGTYTSAQSVKLSDATSGATIYYTTNGTTPNTSSTRYNSPITVSSTEKFEAIAVSAGHANSELASAAYTLDAEPKEPETVIDFPSGFSGSPSTIEPIDDAFYSGSTIQLTSLKEYEASNVYFKTPVNVQAFTTTFTWSAKCPGGGTGCGDGMGFMIVSTTNPKSPSFWSGGTGSQLSWSEGCTTPSTGRTNCDNLNSILVKFDLFNMLTGSHTANLTGLYSGGELPQPPNPEFDMAPSGISMQSSHLMRATLTYNGTVLYETVTDTATNHSYTNHYTVNIPSLVKGDTAIVGFAGATGTSYVQQNIESWTYTVQ